MKPEKSQKSCISIKKLNFDEIESLPNFDYIILVIW